MASYTNSRLCAEVSERGGYLLESKQFFDCNFSMGIEPHQEVIASHKLILAMASPVFESMFYGNMPEKSDIIRVEDIQPETFKLLLQYVYTGNLNLNTVDEVCKLYYAANKYMMQHLLEVCTRYLWHNVKADTVWQLFEFAKFYDNQELLLKCEKVISTDTVNLLNNSSFENVELETVIAVFTFDTLTINSELDLVKAAARYITAQNTRIIKRNAGVSSDNGLSTEINSFHPTLSGEVHEPNIKNTLDAAVQTHEDGDHNQSLSLLSGPSYLELANNTWYRKIVEKIRFLRLTPEQFAECSDRATILTMSDEYAVLMNLVSNNCNVPLPSGFSKTITNRHLFSEDGSNIEDETRLQGAFNYVVRGFDNLESTWSPPCYVRSLPWQLNVKQNEQGSYSLSIRCSDLKTSGWQCEATVFLTIVASDDRYHKNLESVHMFSRDQDTFIFSTKSVEWPDYIMEDGSVFFNVEIECCNAATYFY